MPWVKLDDSFFDNVKVVRAGRDARDLYVAGLCFCARRLTDGMIPFEQIPRLAADAGVFDADTLSVKLVTVGLWEQTDQGYFVHDYLEYNPTREEALALREARAQAGSIGGQYSVVSKRQAKAQANATANGEAKGVAPTQAKLNPVPVPVPGSPDPDPEPIPVPEPKEVTTDASASGAPRRVPAYAEQFTALCEACGITKARLDGNKLARGEVNNAAKALGNQTAEEIAWVAAEMRRQKFQQITPSAIAKHTPRLLGARARASPGSERDSWGREVRSPFAEDDGIRYDWGAIDKAEQGGKTVNLDDYRLPRGAG